MAPLPLNLSHPNQVTHLGVPPLLKVCGLHKRFHGALALQGVDFTLGHGEIVALVGQNGAGKSTLVSIIGGTQTHDEGSIYIEGSAVRIASPRDAEQLGIGFVHQEPTLVPCLSVAENVFLGRELLRGRVVLDRRAMRNQAVEILQRLGFHIDPDRLVADLRLVEREVVEIAKAMLARPRILILDEVTAPLNPAEVDHVFAMMKELKTQGIGIIFISHRLSEVVSMSDRIEVLRDGLNAGSLGAVQRPSEKAIIDLMLGSSSFSADAIFQEPRVTNVTGKTVGELVVQRLGRNGLFSNVSLVVNQGEIVGLAGLKGSGISDIMKTIFGDKPAESGQVIVDGKPLVSKSPRDAISAGIGMITNDRQGEGLALHRSIQENVTVCTLRALRNRFLLTLPARLAQAAARYVSEVGAKHSSLDEEVINLSGGNQQKILVAKWLLRDLQYLLVDEPTRGVDVKSQADIHRLMLQLRTRGRGLLVSSPDVLELLRICDRILVVTKGTIIGEIRRDGDGFSEASILAMLHRETSMQVA